MSSKITKEELEKMFQQARFMLKHAYSPYSNFQVGACLKTKNNQFFSGCNIENASYSLVQCAEACAIANMISAGEKDIVGIVVVSSGEPYCSPCGACRQRLREFAVSDLEVYMYNGAGNYRMHLLEELLPLSFGPHNLE